MVQNTTYTDTDQQVAGQTSINYNTDKAYGGSDGFQTGSSFKAFTLAAWLEAGHSLSDTVDTTQHYFPASEFTNSCANIAGSNWPVANADPAAPELSVLQATAQSVNSAFAKMGTQLDLCNILDDATAMGIHAASTDNPLTSVPAMILGINYIAPLTMATAYAGIADAGTVCTPVAIDSITNSQGQSITPTATTCTQGMPSDIAAGVAYALQTVLKPGGTGALANPNDGVPLLAKTGTTDGAEQNWLIASSTKVTNATWVGNVTGSSDFYNTYVNGVEGYNLKFDIDKPILQALDASYGGGAFPTPSQALIGG
jgi:membrane peptidoglycan carboxypeptidase